MEEVKRKMFQIPAKNRVEEGRELIFCVVKTFLNVSKEYNRKENFLCFYMLYSAVERVIFSGKI
jgi:hypothetical protein